MRAVALAVLAVAPSCAAVAADVARIDPAHTRISFEISSTAWPTTRGRFLRFDGRVALDFDRPARSSVRIVVQSGSVDVGSSGLNDYVRSAVFFDAARHPTMTFVSTAVEKLDERTARVTGDLTLLGVTKPLTLTVVVDRGRREAVGLSARARINRSDFGMNAGVPVINDAVDLTVTSDVARAP